MCAENDSRRVPNLGNFAAVAENVIWRLWMVPNLRNSAAAAKNNFWRLRCAEDDFWRFWKVPNLSNSAAAAVGSFWKLWKDTNCAAAAENVIWSLGNVSSNPDSAAIAEDDFRRVPDLGNSTVVAKVDFWLILGVENGLYRAVGGFFAGFSPLDHRRWIRITWAS